jgi:hypothetical protein
MQRICQNFTGSRKVLNTDGYRLRECSVWAWDTTKKCSGQHGFSRSQNDFFRIEHDARLGRKFVLLMRYMDRTMKKKFAGKKL